MGDKQGHPFYGNQWTDTRSVSTVGPTVKKGDYFKETTAGPRATLAEKWREHVGDADPGGAQAVREYKKLPEAWPEINSVMKEQKLSYDAAVKHVRDEYEKRGALKKRAEAHLAQEAVEKALAAKPGNVVVDEEARKLLTKLVPNATDADLRVLAMALPGSDVQVRVQGGNTSKPTIILEAKGGGIESSERALRRVKGVLVMENVGIEVDPTLKGAGLGAVLFGEQVDRASKIGVKAITADCARGLAFNGYYTWARMGYDGIGRLRDEVGGEKHEVRVSEQMRTPEGRQAWRARGGAFNGTFSLEPGSYSMRTLNAYLKKGKKGKN